MMKLIMSKTWKEDQLVYVTLSRNEIKFKKKDFIYSKYNYTLEYLNTIKVNFKVKNILSTKVAKRYHPNNISTNIKSVK